MPKIALVGRRRVKALTIDKRRQFLTPILINHLILQTFLIAWSQSVFVPHALKRHESGSITVENVGRACLLLVEDNAINQQIAMELLESADIVVDVASWTGGG